MIPGPVNDFTNLLHREIIKRGQDFILSSLGLAVKLAACLLLLACDFFQEFFALPDVARRQIFIRRDKIS